MRAVRPALICAIALGYVAAGASASWAQEIYRWTDEQGNIYFGNSPPPQAKGLQAEDRPKSEEERQCEAAARRQCQKDVGQAEEFLGNFNLELASDATRKCIAAYSRNCSNFSKPKPVPTSAQRVIVTPRLKFDPAAGDYLVCQMTCATACRGDIEVWDTETLGKGQNLGTADYAVKVVPKQPGSAYCRVTTRDRAVGVALKLSRGDTVISRVQGTDGR